MRWQATGISPAGVFVAGALFIVDGVFFTLVLAQRTYFQKIADPADIAPTSAVAFTINHIAAVFLPVTFGLLWIRDPAIVFYIGAAVATVSLTLAFLVRGIPCPGARQCWRQSCRLRPSRTALGPTAQP